MRIAAQRAGRALAIASGAWLGAGARAQTLDLGGPERPALATSAVVDLVDRLNAESADLEERLVLLEEAGADEDILLAERLRSRARTDAVRLLTPWLDAYSGGWEEGIAGLTIAHGLSQIDALSSRYTQLAVAARAPGAPARAIVAYQSARAGLRRFLTSRGDTPGDRQFAYASIDEAARAMEMDGPVPRAADPSADPIADARTALSGAPLDEATQIACAEALRRLELLRRSADSATGANDAARDIAECVWLPSLARVEFGEASPAPGILARRIAEAVALGGPADGRSLRSLARGARLLRLIGALRRASFDTRQLAPAVERALTATDNGEFLRIAERVLDICVRWRSLPEARAMPRDLQRGWRLTARAYEDLERSTITELIAIAEQPARLRDPGVISLFANHRAMSETMRRVTECPEWSALLAARGDAPSLAAAETVAGLPATAMEESTRSAAGERLAAIELIIDSIDGSPLERQLAAPGSALDLASADNSGAGRGKDLIRVFRRDRDARLLAWARQNDTAEARLVALNERLLDLLSLVALADDADAVGRINALGAIELDERGVALAAARVREPVREAVTMILRNEVGIAADAIGHAESRAGVLRLMSTLHETAMDPWVRAHRPVEISTASPPTGFWVGEPRRWCALVSRMLFEAGELAPDAPAGRDAIDRMLAYAEWLADRAARAIGESTQSE